jgi:putative transposase
MSANQACFPICVMARVLGVSKAGCYAWRHRPPWAQARADEALLARIKTVHISSRQTYGAPRVHAERRAAGERHGRKRIARLMRVAGLVGASRRRGGPITTQRDKQARPAPDLVDRDFQAAGPNQLWVADITYLPTAAGFLYLAVVVDERCKKAGVPLLMGSVGDAYDNALCESFFATLECQLLERRRFASQVEARMACFSFIEGFYNPTRRHSALGYRSPICYEQEMQTDRQSATP